MEWGLEAVVMGATNYSNNPTKIEWFENRADDYVYDFSQQSFRSFDGDFLEGSKVFGDLEEVYKPFYPGFQSSGRPIQEMRGFEGCVESPEKSPVAATADAALVTKYKRRKKQQKRVVEHVTTDAVPSSDKWAWRKYGQKPIKGSPFPRSYYRCSSSRECLARKQVERSPSDPNSFIISYTEDHNHDQPTRRNALAGSTRSSTTKLNNNNSSAVPSVDLALQVDSPINSSGDNSPAANEGKMVNLSSGCGGGFGDEEFSFMGFEEMDWNCCI